MRLQIFNRIKELLGGLKNTNNKNVFKHIDFFNNQTIDSENENAFYMPAVLVEFSPVVWVQHSNGNQSATIEFQLHIITDARQQLSKAMATNLALCDLVHYTLANAPRGFKG